MVWCRFVLELGWELGMVRPKGKLFGGQGACQPQVDAEKGVMDWPALQAMARCKMCPAGTYWCVSGKTLAGTPGFNRLSHND
jgi:hypothetical protein